MKIQKKIPHCRNSSKFQYKNNRKMPVTQKYMTVPFPGLEQVLQEWRGETSFMSLKSYGCYKLHKKHNLTECKTNHSSI